MEVYQQQGSTDASETIEFKSDGTFVLADGAAIVTEGTYSIDGDQLTWDTDSWCKNVSADAESATYTWTQDGDLLNLSPFVDVAPFGDVDRWLYVKGPYQHVRD